MKWFICCLIQDYCKVAQYQHAFFFLIYFFLILFIYFLLRWVFIASRRLSLAAESRGYSSLQCVGFSLRWLLFLRSTGSRRMGFSSCDSWALERRLSSCGARAQLLRSMWDPPWPGLEPMSPALARRIRNHCATRSPSTLSNKVFFNYRIELSKETVCLI